MSLFSILMTQTGLPALRRAFGEEAVYTPPASSLDEPVITWAILRMSSNDVGQYGERLEPRPTAPLPKSDIERPKIGGLLVMGDKTYRIDQQLDESDYFTTVALRELESPA